MTYETLLDYSLFKQVFGESSHIALQKAGNHIDNLDVWDLENLVHAFYKKWPHNRNKEIMQYGIKRALQARHFGDMFKNPDGTPKTPTETMLERDRKAAEELCLRDMAWVEPKKEEKIKKVVEKSEKAKEPKAPRPPKPPKNEFAAKVATMSLDDLITWAKELGVPEANIEKHKAKPLGLAKMNISNMIRAKVKS